MSSPSEVAGSFNTRPRPASPCDCSCHQVAHVNLLLQVPEAAVAWLADAAHKAQVNLLLCWQRAPSPSPSASASAAGKAIQSGLLPGISILLGRRVLSLFVANHVLTRRRI